MYNVLVTAVGAIIGYGLVHSARKANEPLRIVGMDIYEDAVGQHWCDEFVRAVPAASDNYPEFIETLVREHAIDLVLPGVEYDALRMSQERERFAVLPARFVLNSKTLVESDSDKWNTHCRQAVAGIPTIDTKASGEFSELAKALGIPFLVKPRRSSASKGHHRISTALEYEQAQARLASEFVAQRIVGTDDAEYTVGVFGYGDGTSSHFLALQRRLSREGSTVKARTVFDAALERTVAELVTLFKPEGPTNLQFRLHDANYLLLEINPRFSSSGSLRTAFGINDVELCIEYYLKGRRPVERQVRPGSAVRYIEDLVVYDRADS